MSVRGQRLRFRDVRVASALPLKAGIHRERRHVSKVPAGDSGPAIGRTCGVAVNECRKAEAMN
jgi:hypothetical protein